MYDCAKTNVNIGENNILFNLNLYNKRNRDISVFIEYDILSKSKVIETKWNPDFDLGTYDDMDLQINRHSSIAEVVKYLGKSLPFEVKQWFKQVKKIVEEDPTYNESHEFSFI